ncbi:methyltransferase, TIGR00027 family [Frankia sp. EI5c]|uniref:class I SAM-dependent methyltransferase n=1 Tax=Frankia sp. EI5c TaxID=683316 RepID=UPI0007C2E9C0|nr:class I SAM-dependent methyltransferase [Frankia sp. EI5c]OAA21788.1 methyltransferase, TIGR00027 family [Frankia sp. EI5c]
MKAAEGSRTAVLVCQGRAAADGLAESGRFTDPVAIRLLRDDERRAVERVRGGEPPTRWVERVDHESVRACAAVMVLRTVAIDDALRERLTPQVVLLGAGLDARAWRLPELADRAVFEVDHPDSQRDKRARLAGLPEGVQAVRAAEPVRFVPVDLTHERLDTALAAAGHRADLPTTWVWEGVVPYLTRHEVARTVAAIAALSSPGTRLIVNYQALRPSIVAGQLLAKLLQTLARRRSLWANEPWRSYWTARRLGALLGRHGFTVVADEDLLAVATRLALATARRASLRSGRIAVADRPGRTGSTQV